MIDPLDKTAVTNEQARKTAFIVAGVLLLIAAWNFYHWRTIVVVALGGIGAALVISGLFIPIVARHFHILWMQAAAVLGFVNSRVLLTLMYYGMFTPYSFASRLISRDPLNRRRAAQPSYWVRRKTTKQSKEQFERLF